MFWGTTFMFWVIDFFFVVYVHFLARFLAAQVAQIFFNIYEYLTWMQSKQLTSQNIFASWL